MSYQATIIEVFLSSPSDVNPERSYIIELAAEWNRLRSRDMGCFISILTWEEMVAPALHGRSQEAVADQIGNNYDVYLGMMWTKLGTPTGIADSGTVEEFNDALARANAGGHLRIATLFKRAQVDPFELDSEQIGKVAQFKSLVSEKGLFYREFSDDNSLRSIINLLFEQIAKDKSRYSSNPISLDIIEVSSKEAFGSSSMTELDGNDQVGLIELGEQFEELAGKFTKKMVEIGNQETLNTENVKQCSVDIDAMLQQGGANPAAAKKVMSKAARGMERLSDYLDSSLPIIDEMAIAMAHMIDEDLRIRLDFADPMESAADNLVAIRDLSLNIAGAVENIDVLIASTDSVPRLSTEVNRAKNRLSRLRTKLRNTFVSLGESINNSIEYFEGRAV